MAMDRKTVESWKSAIGLAAEGKVAWLDKILTAAGSVRSFGRLATWQVARIFGVTHQAVRLWHTRTGCPRNEDGTYNLLAIVDWKVARAKEEVLADLRRRGLTDDDMLENMGGTSQWLEAYRKEKTLETRRKNEIEAGRLVSVVEVTKMIILSNRCLRDGLESLERQLGREVGDRIRFWLNEADEQWRRQWESSDEPKT